jgi:hypothetical protein
MATLITGESSPDPNWRSRASPTSTVTAEAIRLGAASRAKQRYG